MASGDSSDKRTAVSTTAAPPPLPQFSQGINYNGLLFCSGSVGMDPETKTLVEGSIKDRARQCLRNLSAVLEAGGSGIDRVLKVNIYLTDMANFAATNEAYDEFFTQEPKPVSPSALMGIIWMVINLRMIGTYLRCRAPAAVGH